MCHVTRLSDSGLTGIVVATYLDRSRTQCVRLFACLLQVLLQAVHGKLSPAEHKTVH